MKHYDVVIITKNNIPTDFINDLDYLLINSDIKLENEYQVNNISFDYLITDSIFPLTNINILTDDNIIITNNVFQTSIDNVFYIGKENKSNFSFIEQFNIVIQFLKNPFK